MTTTAHREEHEHAIGKVIGTLAPAVMADWVAVAIVLTNGNRITHRHVEAFNCTKDEARTYLLGMLAEAYDLATAQYEEIAEA